MSILSMKDDKIRSMAALLRSGAALTSMICPACSSPLFRLRDGEIWCGQCEKKVVIVSDGKRTEETTVSTKLDEVQQSVLAKIFLISKKMESETNIEDIGKLSSILSVLLDNLEKIRKADGSAT